MARRKGRIHWGRLQARLRAHGVKVVIANIRRKSHRLVLSQKGPGSISTHRRNGLGRIVLVVSRLVQQATDDWRAVPVPTVQTFSR